jgi:hypothetical protein
MSARQSQRQGQSSGGSGCGGIVATLIVLGLAIEYWYVLVGVIVVCGALYTFHRARKKRRERHRPGPRDPWLNEVNVALADLDLMEYARNRNRTVGGIPAEGDIELRTRRLELRISLFADGRLAHQAEMGLRADPRFRGSLGRGYQALAVHDSVLFLATGRGGVVDEILLDEVTRVVGRLPIGPALTFVTAPARVASAEPRAAAQPRSAITDVLGELGRLRDAGVLTDEELADAKTSMLRRL